jgi:hypothetical protein
MGKKGFAYLNLDEVAVDAVIFRAHQQHMIVSDVLCPRELPIEEKFLYRRS